MSSADQANRAEPFWLREHLVPHLDLPADLPVHFVDEKTVTATDLDARQNRFCLPNNGVLRNLRPILTAKQLQAANLRYEEDDDAPAADEQERIRKKKRKRRCVGGVGGLPVLVVDVSAGIVELEMSRGPATSVKGEGYMDFIADCSFTVGDVVQIWAFNPRFSPLCLVINKKPKQTLS
uniref:Uncharacterized protein n=1 Tax=Avena sativa TaxID=4498 RepID=A0ACD5T6X6_AVESA